MTTFKFHPRIMATRFKNHQIEVLKAAFGESENLTKEKKNELVAATGLDVELIAGWFSRRRARKRPREATEELELEYSALKQAIKLNRGNEAELKRELLGSKKWEAELQDENWRLKELITISESDEQFCLLKKWFVNGH